VARRLSPLKRLAACLAALAPCAAFAAPAGRAISEEVLQFDAAHSSAEFAVRVMWLFPVHGRFGTLRGTITIDRFRGTARVDADIDTNDIHMRSRGDEAWAKSPEFFDSQHYPQVHFESDAFSLDRLSKGGAVEGMLTIRGFNRHETFELAPSACPDAVALDCAAEAEGSIRRSDFGMRSHRGALSDKVDLHFSIHVQPRAAP